MLIGPLLKAPTVVRWLFDMRWTHKETREVLRHALATALCRTSPDSPRVEKLAGTIEERLWRVSRDEPARGRVEGVMNKGRRRLRRSARQLEWRHVDWLHWRDDMSDWIYASVSSGELRDLRTTESCPETPRNAATFAKLFPSCFLAELEHRKRGSKMRSELLARVDAADEMRRKRGMDTRRLVAVATGTAVVGAGAGFGLSEVFDAEVVEAALAAGAGGLLGAGGGVRGRGAARRRTQAREQVCQWMERYHGAVYAPPATLRFDREDSRRELLDDLGERLVPLADRAHDEDLAGALIDLQGALAQPGVDLSAKENVLTELLRVIANVDPDGDRLGSLVWPGDPKEGDERGHASDEEVAGGTH